MKVAVWSIDTDAHVPKTAFDAFEIGIDPHIFAGLRASISVPIAHESALAVHSRFFRRLVNRTDFWLD